MPHQESNDLQHVLPKGIWLTFDFDDAHPVPQVLSFSVMLFMIMVCRQLMLFCFNFDRICPYYLYKVVQSFLWVLPTNMLVKLIFQMT